VGPGYSLGVLEERKKSYLPQPEINPGSPQPLAKVIEPGQPFWL